MKNNITIYYFSVTRNTETISRAICEQFRTAGKTCNIIHIDEIKDGDSMPEDHTFGFISPIYAGGTAKPFEQFIKAVPEVSEGEAFVVSNGAGDGPEISNDFMIKRLRAKGFNILGCGFTKTPSALAPDESKGGMSEGQKRRMIERAVEKAKHFAQRLTDGEKPWEYGIPSLGKTIMHGMFNLMFNLFGKPMIEQMKKSVSSTSTSFNQEADDDNEEE